MKKNNFLSKLGAEGKLELVEPSEEVCSSYTSKADDCLVSARLLFRNKLYENSVTMSYYTMYNSLVGLLFRFGIKSENHAGSILLFKLLFDKVDLFKVISEAKKERIDKQYYVSTEKDDISKEAAEELVSNAEDFLLKMKLMIKNIKNEEIGRFRKDFGVLVEEEPEARQEYLEKLDRVRKGKFIRVKSIADRFGL